MINMYNDKAVKLKKHQNEEQQEEEQQKLAAEKNLVITDSCAAEAKVGSLVPSEWVQEREFSASKTGEEVVVGDLVVVMRSDGSMRFGEIMALNSASVCQVTVGQSSEGSLLVKEVVVSRVRAPNRSRPQQQKKILQAGLLQTRCWLLPKTRPPLMLLLRRKSKDMARCRMKNAVQASAQLSSRLTCSRRKRQKCARPKKQRQRRG